jgi:hypothetical protein
MLNPPSSTVAEQSASPPLELISQPSTQWLLWAMNQGATSTTEFNISIAIDFYGVLDAPTLQLAFYDVVARHPILRGTFVQRQGSLYRSCEPWPTRQSAFIISQVSSVEDLSKASSYGFVVCSEPPIRAFLLSLHSHRHVVLVILHRVACDIWSSKPLAKELVSSYLAFLHQGKSHDKAQIDLQASVPCSSLGKPFRGELTTEQVPCRKGVGVRLNSFMHKKLTQLVRKCDASVPALLHAAIAIACARILSPGSTLVMEHPNRPSRQSRSLIGQHSKFLVQSSPQHDSMTFREALDLSHRMLGEMNSELSAQHMMAPKLSCTTSLIVIHERREDLTLRLRDSSLVLKSPAAAPGPFDLCFDLTIHCDPAGQPAGIDGMVFYKVQTLKRDLVERLIRTFAGLVEAVTDSPDVPLHCLDLDFANSLEPTSSHHSKSQMNARPPEKMMDATSSCTLPRRSSAERTRYIRPTNPTHHMILKIWQDLLKVNRIGVQDAFDELGGSETLLREMLSHVALAFGEQIAPSVFAEPVTIDRVTKELVKRGAARSCRSIGCNDASQKKPLFLLHGDIDGGGYYGQRIVQSLDPVQPVYLLNPHGMDGGFLPASVEEMARSYLEVILGIQNEEPFSIAGYCNAGLVAFEIARQLQTCHQLTSRPGLISTLAASESAAAAEFMFAATPLTHSKRYFMASSGYRPGSFDGEVTLFLPRRFRNVEAQCKYWKEYARNVRYQPICGNHANCLTKWVDDLGEQLSAWMNA